MSGYSPALAELGQLSALDLVERYTILHPTLQAEIVAAMSRDTLIEKLLPPPRTLKRRPVRPYPKEAAW